ncbi:hypothetical protein AV530_017520 [Patagioenas fasciata monilis]|uniref:Uncharacterized protein n=1 Tax=Patagioenas fasciata monilis TaxID=372326 RepID=A0A1V4JEV9_PATFA|nr:hypothetical protein AV530_017520 [Patagioenas fasciata monilis]
MLPDPPAFSRLRHEEKEFTVQIKDEEGLKLTFQKHRLVPNGAPQKKNSKKLVELELRCLEGLRDPGGPQSGEPPPPYPEKWPQKKVPKKPHWGRPGPLNPPFPGLATPPLL